MKYTLKDAPADFSLRNAMAQIDSRLSQIEVKGDSVILMSQARSMLNDLWSSLEEIQDEMKKEEEGKNDLS